MSESRSELTTVAGPEIIPSRGFWLDGNGCTQQFYRPNLLTRIGFCVLAHGNAKVDSSCTIIIVSTHRSHRSKSHFLADSWLVVTRSDMLHYRQTGGRLIARPLASILEEALH